MLEHMPKRPRDTNQLAKMIVDLATGEIDEEMPESPKVRAGRLGGLKGGRARAETLSKKRRSEIAKKAAEARWKNKSKGPSD
jgi:hypothetical protein